MELFKLVANDDKCKALLGENPTRFYPIIGVEHDETPFATYQTITGAPENMLGCRPQIDSFTVQIDAYAKTYQEVKKVAHAIRDAIELHCYVTSWRGVTRDHETKLYRLSFDVSIWSHRK